MFMKRLSGIEPRRWTLLLALAVSGAAALVGWKMSLRQVTSPSLNATASPASVTPGAFSPTEFLASLPEVLDASASAQSDKEIAKWKQRLGKKPDDAGLWLNLGDALMQKARETANHQYYDWAEKAYHQSLVLSPEKSDAMTGLAWVCGERHQFPESIAWGEKAIAINAKDEAAYGLIGDAQIELGDYKGAFKSYQQMLDIRPDLASYSRGANLLYLTGDTRKGMWLMTKAIKAGGAYGENTAWCSAKLAEMLVGEGAVVPAESILKDAAKIAPNNYYVLAAMGKVQTARGNYPEAIALYQKAVAIAPQHAGLVALGDLYTVTGQKDKAEETFALVERMHEEHKKYGNGDELYMARFFAEHDRQLPRALAIAQMHQDTKNAVNADTVAWCYYKNNKLPEAKAQIKRALTAAAPDAPVLFHAGMICARLGERPVAQKYLYQALSRNPYFSLMDATVAVDTLKTLGNTPPAMPPGGVPMAGAKRQ